MHADPTLVSSGDIEKGEVARSAAMLTAEAYGLADWAFVAPSDCGLGLFARAPLRAGQYIIEYDGPRLPIECIHKGEYVLQFPSSGLAIDGRRENTIGSQYSDDIPSPAIFANHSSSPNAAVQHWPSVNGAPERLVLVATEAVDAGQELRFDYENGGSRGQYWGPEVRPRAPTRALLVTSLVCLQIVLDSHTDELRYARARPSRESGAAAGCPPRLPPAHHPWCATCLAYSHPIAGSSIRVQDRRAETADVTDCHRHSRPDHRRLGRSTRRHQVRGATRRCAPSSSSCSQLPGWLGASKRA